MLFVDDVAQPRPFRISVAFRNRKLAFYRSSRRIRRFGGRRAARFAGVGCIGDDRNAVFTRQSTITAKNRSQTKSAVRLNSAACTTPLLVNGIIQHFTFGQGLAAVDNLATNRNRPRQASLLAARRADDGEQECVVGG